MFLSAPSERPANLLPSLSNFDPADGFCNELIEALPRLKLLVDNYEELRDEFRAVFSQLDTVNWGADDENDTGYFGEKKLAKHDGYWKNIPLYGQGKEFEDSKIDGGNVSVGGTFAEHKHNCELLPKLVSTARKANCVKRVGINVLEPGKTIKPHFDREPDPPWGYLIRGLFGLDVGDEDGGSCHLALLNQCTKKIEVAEFKNKEFMFFWGRNRHAVYNTLKRPRSVLVIDHEVRTSF